ncbi:MAG: hypothetical protein OCU12_02455 [Methanophagales archaeon]|nr:hypothetical protein [Methanophagales archaeon]
MTVFFIGLLGIPVVLAGLLCFVVGVVVALVWIQLASASLYLRFALPRSKRRKK